MTFLLPEIAVLTVLLLAAVWCGYVLGVRDTEERWSDAVRRKGADEEWKGR